MEGELPPEDRIGGVRLDYADWPSRKSGVGSRIENPLLYSHFALENGAIIDPKRITQQKRRRSMVRRTLDINTSQTSYARSSGGHS